jgi:hypothetical protein
LRKVFVASFAHNREHAPHSAWAMRRNLVGWVAAWLLANWQGGAATANVNIGMVLTGYLHAGHTRYRGKYEQTYNNCSGRLHGTFRQLGRSSIVACRLGHGCSKCWHTNELSINRFPA